MKKVLAPISGIVTLIIIIWIFQSGIIEWISTFLSWYIHFRVTTSNLNNIFVLLCKILTWVISYGIVGLIFNSIGLFNSKAMSITYIILSFFINIALTLVLKFLQDYAWIIGIILIIATVCLLLVLIIRKVSNSKRGNVK